jgi:putative nucleotidyltransferase with HDIG domain
MSARKQVEVGALELGMYVAELDRPWIESPFLFQGFVIENEDDLRQLREICSWVVVDEEMTVSAQRDKTIALSMKMKDGGRSAKPTTIVWAGAASEARRAELQSQLKQSFEVRKNTKDYVAKVFEDVRLGTSINAPEAKEVVNTLVDVVTEHADTLMWMTQLKQAHEYTLQHSVNVCILSLAFSHHLGYAKEQMQTIGLGALLHDIGKTKTPPEVLDKPGKLTPAEFEIIRRHPVDGWNMIKDNRDVPHASLEIIKYHHERISGRGYPEGLSGRDLSTHVLMVAICDVYDAITSDRVYHHGIPAHEGLSAMYQLAPNEFGKELMQEFIRCIGIYPVGSLVELSTGALGIVMVNDPANRLRPVVMLVRDPKGQLYMPRRYVALAAQGDIDHKWNVLRIVDPKNYGINLQAILMSEVFEGGGTQVYHL